ncbi:hypothetical protein KQR57_05375 [Bacillus inaquosorum]|nr:hypothetical protein [Bacillus inaquosorum]
MASGMASFIRCLLSVYHGKFHLSFLPRCLLTIMILPNRASSLTGNQWRGQRQIIGHGRPL